MKKYRPVLSASQIAHLISLCKNDLSSESISCIGILSPFMAKIENAAITPAYTLSSNKQSLVDELGLGEETIINKSHEMFQKHLYEQWLAVGMKYDSFSLNEIKEIKEFRYLNDLMTTTESDEYESENQLTF